MNKYFHGLLLGVSVLPALAIMPVMAVDVANWADLKTAVESGESVVFTGNIALTGAEERITASGVATQSIDLGRYVVDGTGAPFDANLLQVTAKDLTIKNGAFSNLTRTTNWGSVLHLTTDGNLTIDGTNFSSNKSETAAVLSVGTAAGSITIKNSIIENNEAKEIGAVGLYKAGTFENVTFKNNRATNASGDGIGALFLGSVSTAGIGNSVNGSVFLNNTSANRAGAIGMRDFYQGNNSDATLDINNTKFIGNRAATNGGAIDNYFYNDANNDGYVKITDSVFESNSAAKGGAIYNRIGVIGDNLKISGKQTAESDPDTIQVGNIYFSGITFNENTATTAGGAIYNEGIISFAGTNTFSGNKANGKANDIHNVGTVNIASGTTTMDGGITGGGTLAIAQGATLNIGTASVEQGAIALDGTMLATLRDGDAQITAGTFDGNGTLKLSFAGEGTYHVFGNTAFRKAGIDVTSSMYDITWADNDKDLIASVKSVEDIAEANGIEQDTAAAIVGLNTSTSEKLNDLGVLIQEKLAEATPEAKHEVEQATKAIHPEKESVTQAVATSVQTTVTNLASARMAAPTIGRNGGDLNLTSGGVWAQGLFNKSKQNNSFDGYTRGVAVGLDGTINKVWTVGAGYSYAHSDINGSARDTEIDSNTVFVYGQYKPAEWYVNAVANYTMSDYSEKGAALGTPVTADYDIDSFGVAIATGYDFASGVTPELGLRYMHVNSESYTNSLDVKNKFDSTDYMTAMLGTKYGFNIMANRNIMFRPELRCAVKYDLLSDKSSASVMMPGVNAYTINGDRLSRIGGEFGIGLGMKYNAMDLSINYDIDVRDDYTSQTGMLKFRYNF